MDYGIDVSHWNAITDAHAVRASGITFAWCKATEGVDYIDPTFHLKVAQLREAGIIVGAYHFIHGSNIVDQAHHFADVAGAARCLSMGALAPMIDMEASDARAFANTIIPTFFDVIANAPQIVYGNKDWWENVLRPADWGDRLLLRHIARYNGNPGNPEVAGDFAVHQHTNTGIVPGIPGSVDRNATMAPYSLEHLTIGQILPTLPTPVPLPTLPAPAGDTWTVRPGDTLSRIASAWGLTVSAVAVANQIPNPDLIFPNQVIHRPGSPGAAPPPTGGTWYTIAPGDTLSEIATRYGTTVATLTMLNRISNPDRIFAGDRLQLPGAVMDIPAPAGVVDRIYIVDEGDTLSRIAARLGYPGGYPALAARNHITNPNRIFPGQQIHY